MIRGATRGPARRVNPILSHRLNALLTAAGLGWARYGKRFRLVPLTQVRGAAEPRRNFSRLQVGIIARLDMLSGWQKVRLIDLSQGGAQLILSRPQPLDEGVLRWLRFEVYGDVVWQEDEHVGLKFDGLLPLARLVETRQRAPTVVREEAMATEIAAQDFVAGNRTLGADR